MERGRRSTNGRYLAQSLTNNEEKSTGVWFTDNFYLSVLTEIKSSTNDRIAGIITSIQDTLFPVIM